MSDAPAPDRLDGALWAAVDGLMAAAVRERSALAGVLGLRPVDLDALRLIVVEPGVSPTSVALGLRMSAGGTAAVVTRLAEAGLVTRSRRPDGRRRVGLQPTSDGVAALEAHRAPLVAQLDGLGDAADRDRAVDCLVAAAAALDRQTGRHVAATPPAEPEPTGAVARVLWG